MNEIIPVRLRLELKGEYLSDGEIMMLRRYGEATKKGSFIRDILIPSDMPLHNLHYAIQKLFGWKNSHLRRFCLHEKEYKKVTDGMVKGWSDLVGVLFQPPSEGEHDLFWDDDYNSGSINVWLRKKYTGPYMYGGTMERPEIAKQDVQALLDRFPALEVGESFQEYMERKKQGHSKDVKVKKVAPLATMTLEEMNKSIFMESGTESLLERLKVDDVIASENETLAVNRVFPATHELLYNYDFGDDWMVSITKHDNCDDLFNENIIDEAELAEAEEIVCKKHKPVCLNKIGISLLDDVGGLSGFANFLKTLYEGKDKEEAAHMRAWSKEQGWNNRKVSFKKLL